MDRRLLAVLLLPLSATACVSTPSTGPDPAMRMQYEQRLAEWKRPSTEAEHSETCKELRVEIARQNSLATYAAPDIQALAARNVALIQSRMVDFDCDHPFTPPPAG